MNRLQMLAMLGVGLVATSAVLAQAHAKSPADGYSIHLLAPHRHEDGSAQWNKYYHDHTKEIASGSVQVLDLPPQKAKEIAAAAAKTDGIIFHLWPQGSKVPNGDVSFPTAISHQPVQTLVIPD